MSVNSVNDISNIKTVDDLFKLIYDKLNDINSNNSKHLLLIERENKNKDRSGNINSIDINLYRIDIEDDVLNMLNKSCKNSVKNYMDNYDDGYNYSFHHKEDDIRNLNKFFIDDLANKLIDDKSIYNLDKWNSTVRKDKVKYGWIYLLKINHEILFFMENLDKKIIVENMMDYDINKKLPIGDIWIIKENGTTDRFKLASENMFAISDKFFAVGYINIEDENNLIYYCAVIRENDFDTFFNLKNILLSKAEALVNSIEGNIKNIFEDDKQYTEFKIAILNYVKYYKKLARLSPDILTTDFSMLMQCDEIKKSLENEGLRINENGKIELISNNKKVPIETLLNLIICKEAISADGKKRVKSKNPVVKTK